MSNGPAALKSAEERLVTALGVMVRIRWLGVVFCLLQVFLVNRLLWIGPPPPWVQVLEVTLTALLIGGNLVVRSALRRIDSIAAARRLAVASLVLDAVVVKGFVFLYVYDANAAMFALLYVLVLEAAILFQLRGAMIMMAAATVFYVLRDVYGVVVLGLDSGRTGPLYPPAITFRMAIGWLIAGVAGMMASSLVRQRDELAEAKSDVEAYADRLAATNTELEAARVRAEEATRSKSAFLASMSHELRTPMNAVIGMTHLLATTRLDSEQTEYLAAVRNSAEVLLSTINDVLDFSKIEAGRLDIDRRPEPIRPLVESTLDLIAPLASSKRIDLVYHVEDDVPSALVTDGHRLRQVLVNLLTNAVKFTDSGEVALLVSHAANGGDGRIVFEVRDSGIGIAEDAQATLFDSFTQADASTTRQFGGTGLGLAISQRIVGLLGGVIEVESEVGVGSRFTFSIPADVAPVETVRTDASTERTLAGRSVLIADANATDRRLLAGFVRTWGMHPLTASNLTDALAAATRTDRVDVILIDHRIDARGGLDTAARLAAHPSAGSAPRVLLAMLGTAEPAEGAPDSRADEPTENPDAESSPMFAVTVTKPVKQSSLFDALVTVLSGRVETAAVPVPTVLDPAFARRHPLQVLAAEDNPTNRRLITRLLERLGYAPLVVADGVEAVEAVRERAFDLVLMDVQMPRLDGLAATRRIRAENGHQPWIVAMTANTTVEDRQACREVGMNDYLGKPIRPEQLTSVLERAWQHGESAIPPGPAAGAAAPEELIDVLALRRLVDLTGDRPFVESLLAAFPNELDGLVVSIREATEPSEMRRHAHSLKSSAASLGATSLAACARQLEDAALSGDATTVGDLLAQLEDVAASTVEAMYQLEEW